MKSLKLILFFLLFSPLEVEDIKMVDSNNSDQGEKVFRADSPSVSEFIELVRSHENEIQLNKSFKKKIDGYGWSAELSYNRAAVCFNESAQWDLFSSRALISDELLKRCYRSKSMPSPEVNA